MEDKDRIALLLSAIQMFSPAMDDRQVKAAIKAIFDQLGVELPDAAESSSLVV